MHIHIRHAKQYFYDRKVLDIEDFSLKHNKIYCILGSNGSGKSTFINGLAGLQSFTKSEISYDGLPLFDAYSKIAIMVQNPYIFNDTLLNNLILPLKFQNLSKKEIDIKLNTYLSFFDLKDKFHIRATKLSGGEKAKVSMLRVALTEKPLILLDEPTSSMDIHSTFQGEKLIKHLKSIGVTVIFISHDFMQAKRIADYIIFMDKGKIIEWDSTDIIFNNPKSALLKKYLS